MEQEVYLENNALWDCYGAFEEQMGRRPAVDPRDNFHNFGARIPNEEAPPYWCRVNCSVENGERPSLLKPRREEADCLRGA
jgi:hypothetical protein